MSEDVEMTEVEEWRIALLGKEKIVRVPSGDEDSLLEEAKAFAGELGLKRVNYSIDWEGNTVFLIPEEKTA